MSESKLSEELERLNDKEGFVNYVYGLLDDFRSNQGGWENQDLPSFLEAVAAWADDMNSFYASQGRSVPENISWKVFAEILTAARFYE